MGNDPINNKANDKKRFHDFFLEERGPDLFQNIDDFFCFLLEAKKNGEYGFRRPLVSGTKSRVQVLQNGEPVEMIMMGSNNYLDLAFDPQVVNAAQRALEKYGYGSGSVALLGGTSDLLKTLENKIAQFYFREAAAVFPTGYSTNVGIISALIKPNDLILMDMYSHASLVDGTKLSGATVKFFKHNDMDHLEKLLQKLRNNYSGVLIVTDGVFSMDGDVCDLNGLLELKKKYNARLMIDEAHAIGIIGTRGRGTEEYFNKINEVDIIAGTLSKAPAGLGGYIAGKESLVEYIRHFANSYVFSTSLPPSVVGGLIEVFNILENDFSRKEKLQRNIDHFTKKLREHGFNIGNTITAIVPVIIGDEEKTRIMSKELAKANIFSSAVMFPAVSKNQARLRMSLMSSHTKEDLDYVINKLVTLKKAYGI